VVVAGTSACLETGSYTARHANLLQQQAKFDDFVQDFNNERPHEALKMKCAAEFYTASTRPYQGFRNRTYLFHDRTVMVTSAAAYACIAKDQSQPISRRPGCGRWLVSFMDYDLGLYRSGGENRAAPR